jgi:SAM-dependent methyltransferase
MVKIPLKKVPSGDWIKEYEKVLDDPYIKKKYDRDRRVADKLSYVNRYFPFLKRGGKTILDIGPGPGEFLEVCRYYGNNIFGADAPLGDCEMGDSYIRLSYLMNLRQGLNIEYKGLDLDLYGDSSFDVINSQGSIEQVFRDCLMGVPHKEEKNCMLLSWKEDEVTRNTILDFLKNCYRCLKNDGQLLIYGNGAKNVKYYDNLIQNLSKEAGFSVKREKNRLHIMEKKHENTLPLQ